MNGANPADCSSSATPSIIQQSAPTGLFGGLGLPVYGRSGACGATTAKPWLASSVSMAHASAGVAPDREMTAIARSGPEVARPLSITFLPSGRRNYVKPASIPAGFTPVVPG